jgi:hypothetical protein
MKKLFLITNFILSILLPIQGMAQTSEQKPNSQQAVKCTAKIHRYGNSSDKMIDVGQSDLKLMDASLTNRTAIIENKTFQLSEGYELSVSGVVIRPGGKWTEVSSIMSIQFTFSKMEDGKRKFLAQDTVNSDRVHNKAELEAVQNGILKTSTYLVNIDYVNEVATGEKPTKDRVVGVQAVCELVSL